MANRKPLVIGTTVPSEQLPSTDTLDAKIYVSGPNKVLGRVTTGDGPHEEIDFGDLPAAAATILDITYADMETAIAGSTLTKGQFYRITDASGTDLGFVTQAVRENEITVSGTGGYLNADFQAVGNYDGVEAITGEAFGVQKGIWRLGFELAAIAYTNLQFQPDYFEYFISSGTLTDAETFTTDLGTTGTIIHDDGSGTVTVEGLSQALVEGEIITGDTSGETVTVDWYTVTQKAFLPGDTITGGTTGATAVVVTDDGASGMTAYMTSSGVAFDGSEALDNGNGVTADMDGVAGSPDIAQGDVVIWNLLHWQLTDAAALDGTDPETNTAAYTQLLKTDTEQGYLEVWDISEFDFPANWIQFRGDKKGNLIRYASNDGLGIGVSAATLFQFGRDSWYGNIVDNGLINQPNFIGNIYGNSLIGEGAYIQGNTSDSDTPSISYCLLQNGSIRDNAFAGSSGINGFTLYGGSVYECAFYCAANNFTLFSGASIDSSTFSSGGSLGACYLFPDSSVGGVTLGENFTFINNILENGASLTGITAGAGCSISNNKIGQGATLGGGTTLADSCEMIGNELGPDAIVQNLTIGDGVFSTNVLGAAATVDTVSIDDGASVEKNVLSSDVAFSNKTIEAGVFFASVTLGVSADETETISENVEVKRADIGYSDIPASIEIDGVTTLDITAAFAQYRGIINVTSPNATEEIDAITNPPTAFPFTIRPEAGLALTITGTAYSGIAAGQIALKATDYVLDGDKGEYIVLEIDPLGSGCLVEKLVVNGIV